MRVPNAEHTSRPWRIHEITSDFGVEDVWALPTPGDRDDFHLLVSQIRSTGPYEERSFGVGRLLWAARWKLGALLGWDRENSGLGKRVASVRDRLPDDLHEGERGPQFSGLPFTSLYQLEDEWAAEIANATIHGVMHIGWVEDKATGEYHGQMAILVKPNGILGRLYMAGIRPFRRLIVYPAWMKQLEGNWEAMTVKKAVSRSYVTGVVGWNSVPEEIRALNPLPSVDYVDVFTLRTDLKASPLEWARVVMEDAAGAGGQGIWRGILGLHLATGTVPDTVAGWTVAAHGGDWIRLEARSWCLTCHVTVRIDDQSVSLATFVNYDRSFGRVLWTPASAAHRRLVPELLGHADSILRRPDIQSIGTLSEPQLPNPFGWWRDCRRIRPR